MRFSLKIVNRSILAGVLALAMAACGGGGSNNDQGTSFSLFGFSKDGQNDNDAGQIAVIGSDFEQAGQAGGLTTFYGMMNALAVEGIRTERAWITYYIEGASEQPPATSVPLAALLGPAGGAPSGVVGTLPAAFRNRPNTVRQEAFIVPPDIISWISMHRSSLPEPPFMMNVTTWVTGISTSGNELTTNEMNYFIQFVQDNIIPPTGGAGSTAGSETEGIEESGSSSSDPSGSSF